MSARFEIVRVDGGWFVRFVAANNRVVWVTPGLYSRRGRAVAAVELILDSSVTTSPFADHPEVQRGPFRLLTEVRDVDERSQS